LARPTTASRSTCASSSACCLPQRSRPTPMSTCAPWPTTLRSPYRAPRSRLTDISPAPVMSTRSACVRSRSRRSRATTTRRGRGRSSRSARRVSRAAEPLAVRLVFLTSTPPTTTEGSGTFVALDRLRRGLGELGPDVTLRTLAFRTRFHPLDRFLFNAGVAAAPPDADVVVGVDLDGFLWARRRRRTPFVVALKGIIADE